MIVIRVFVIKSTNHNQLTHTMNTNTSVYRFSEMAIGQYFRIAGYDDLFRKVTDTRALDCGCGLLNKPVRLARKGARIDMTQVTGFDLC